MKKRQLQHKKSSIIHKTLIGLSSMDMLALITVVIVCIAIISVKGKYVTYEAGNGQEYIPITNAPQNNTSKDNLQLHTFSFVTTTPSPKTVEIACTGRDTDTMLIIDHSSSMTDNKLKKAKEAATLLSTAIGQNSNNRIGLTIFDESSALLSTLTNNVSLIISQINRIPESSGTCIQCGIKTANDEIRMVKTSGIPVHAILLSDGRANRVNSERVPSGDAAKAAYDEIVKGHNENGVILHTIAFGNGANTSWMQQVASITGGTYHFSPSENELAEAFSSIATTICGQPS